MHRVCRKSGRASVGARRLAQAAAAAAASRVTRGMRRGFRPGIPGRGSRLRSFWESASRQPGISQRIQPRRLRFCGPTRCRLELTVAAVLHLFARPGCQPRRGPNSSSSPGRDAAAPRTPTRPEPLAGALRGPGEREERERSRRGSPQSTMLHGCLGSERASSCGRVVGLPSSFVNQKLRVWRSWRVFRTPRCMQTCDPANPRPALDRA